MTPGPDGAPARCFIWGSCVSRDALDHCAWAEVTQYVARQSAISLASDARPVVPPHRFDSPFQERMNVWDLAGNAARLFAELADDIDLFLIDLCDERYGAYEVAPGVYATRTVERLASGIDDEWARRYRLIPFASDEHLALWTQSMRQVLKRARLLRRSHLLRVVALPWAERSEDGDVTTPSAGFSAAEANDAFQRYLDVFRADAVRIVGEDVPAVAAPDHRWGPAPFHYTAPTYEALCAELWKSR